MAFYEEGFFDPGVIEPPPGVGVDDVVGFVCTVTQTLAHEATIEQTIDGLETEIEQTLDLGEVEF